MKVIGLTGFAKSGKSTAAEILKQMGGQEVAFAKHLKDVCSVVFGVPRDHFDDQAFKEVKFEFNRVICGTDIQEILQYFEVPGRFIPAAMLAHQGVEMTSPRHVAQYIGTEVLRTIDSDIHINMAFKLAPKDAKFLICSDMRFKNELLAVQRNEGLTIGISRKAATPANITSLHASEREIPDLIIRADRVVGNEETIENFKALISRMASGYLSK